MRKSMKTCLGALGVTMVSVLAPAAAAAADDALAPEYGNSQTSRWQMRFALGDGAMRRPGFASTGLNPSNASLLGDYYFGRSLAGLPKPSGFRATSGLIFGPRALSTSAAFAGSSSFSVGSQLFGALPMSGAREAGDIATIPYLGVGYTGLKPRSGWRYDADLGLAAQSAGGLKQMRPQSLDDTVRELRLAPLLQLGVSYSY
jgi:hypothetical protein